MQLRSVQPPDVVTSQRRLDVDADSLEVHHQPAGVDNPGYAQDSLEPVHRRRSDSDGPVTPTYANGNARSPTRLQYVPPTTRSPLRGFMVDGRRSATPSSSMLPRTSPVQRPTSAPGGKRSAPLRSTPVGGGLENVYEEEPGMTALPTMMARGRVLTPTVGLTVEEVDRITDSRRCTPAAAAAAAHSSTSSTGRASSPDFVNRTDFTRDDLELVARPRSTTSDDDDDDETQDETFTCSEFDCGGGRRPQQPALDFANPYRLRVPPSLALPPPPPPSAARRSVTPRDPATPRDGACPSSSDGSTADELFSVDARRHATPPVRPELDLTRAAAELGWTQNFDAVAAVFLDLAALSDAGRSTAVAAGGGGLSPVASPARSTPQFGPSHRSDTPSSRTRSPANQVDVIQRFNGSAAGDRVRPLQRLASPAERLTAASNGPRSLTPSAQYRHTPLDDVQRRADASSPAPSPLYMSPPAPVYDGRGQARVSSPRDRIASPAAPDATSRQHEPAAARALPPRTTPRPVLEEYV